MMLIRLLLCGVLLVAQLSAQTAIGNGLERAARIAATMREAELLEAAAARERAATNPQPAQAETSERRERSQQQIRVAWSLCKERHPDMKKYEPEIVRFAALLEPADMSTEDYIEMLYFLAKFSPFSRSKNAVKVNYPGYEKP